ncbi:MAG: hypothetical protein HC898_02275 [Phycisphaerales bacterium]|nr:hypothetical protein [Phycisphaerales bacterium]
MKNRIMKATSLFTADVNNLVQNSEAWVQDSASTVIAMPNPLLANVLTELGLPDVMLVAGIAMVMIF